MRNNYKTPVLFVVTTLLAFDCSAADLKPVDLKFMLRGYCYAASPSNIAKLYGIDEGKNVPNPVSKISQGAEGELSLVALPDEEVPFDKEYRGFRLLLINRTAAETNLLSCDTRLPIVQEALEGEGIWRPVEYLPSSWCGNSYFCITLPAGHYWEFAAPRYSGKNKVLMRFALHIPGEPPVYSKEFEGSVNPEQFTISQEHTPANLMDPYNE